MQVSTARLPYCGGGRRLTLPRPSLWSKHVYMVHYIRASTSSRCRGLGSVQVDQRGRDEAQVQRLMLSVH